MIMEFRIKGSSTFKLNVLFNIHFMFLQKGIALSFKDRMVLD